MSIKTGRHPNIKQRTVRVTDISLKFHTRCYILVSDPHTGCTVYTVNLTRKLTP